MNRIAGLGLALFLTLHLGGGAQAQIEWRGFVEYAVSGRVTDESREDFVLNEGRLQLAGDYYGDRSEAHFAVDLLGDRRLDSEDTEIREAYARIDLFDGKAELRAGRQPATWGTGDLLFINDLFPKDYESFFAGRGDQYLKLPVDALRLGYYPASLTVDFLWIPNFTPNRTPSPERFMQQTLPYAIEEPDGGIEDGEFALRLSYPVSSWKLEGYGYRGFWKNPMGLSTPAMADTALYHPELTAYGASLRGTLRGGIAWVEAGYYDSREDPDGDDPFVPNSQTMALAGYERSWWSDGTVGAQAQWTAYEDSDVDDRVLMTLRVTQLLASQTVKASLFGFYSPSDEDSHIRASLSYDIEDGVTLTAGAHFFDGEATTDFGRVADNDLIYGRLRMMF